MSKNLNKETKMKKNFLKIGILSILFALLIFAGSISVSASAGFYFNGGYKLVSNKGAALTCETQNPYITSNGSSSAWAMTCNPPDQNYAQVGWAKDPGFTAPKYFWEYNSVVTSKFGQEYLATAQSGSHNDFMVGSDSTTMYFKINGDVKKTLPLSDLGWTPDAVELFGETHDTGDQCPGSVSNPVTMGNAQYKTTSGSWVSAGVTEDHDLPTMDNNISTGDTTWEIWDTRY